MDFHDYKCINVLGGEVGKIIEKECDSHGIATSNYWINDDNRINTALVYEYENRMFMINEPGPEMSKDEVEGSFDFFKNNLPEGSRLIISGSAARGFNGDDLIKVIEIARSKGCRIEIDIAGQWLKDLIRISPELLKINADELRVAFGVEEDDLRGMEDFRKKYNIENLIITNGKKGSYSFTDGGIIKVRSTKIYSDFAVGSGDSFFAGLIYGEENNLPLEESLKIATACGTANTLSYGAGIFTREDFDKVSDEVEITEVSL